MLCYRLVHHCTLFLPISLENFTQNDLYILYISLVLSSHCCQHVMQMLVRDATIFRLNIGTGRYDAVGLYRCINKYSNHLALALAVSAVLHLLTDFKDLSP